MSRNKPYSGAALLAATLALVVGVALVACAPTALRLDLATMAPCPGEDGPGAGGTPCVWDASTMGNGEAGPYQVRWTLYAERCPVNTVQARELIKCVARADWSGGVN